VPLRHAVSSVAHHPALRRGREVLLATNDKTLDLQAAIAEIPAPSGAEARRAAFVAGRLRELGLEQVALDGAGNVVARRGHTRGPAIVLAAHLDTVFSADVDHTVHRHGVRLDGPGISDNARGLVGLVALARAVLEAGWATQRPIVFAATVGEEGEGNLRGARYLLGPSGVASFPAARSGLSCGHLGFSEPPPSGGRRYGAPCWHCKVRRFSAGLSPGLQAPLVFGGDRRLSPPCPCVCIVLSCSGRGKPCPHRQAFCSPQGHNPPNRPAKFPFLARRTACRRSCLPGLKKRAALSGAGQSPAPP